MALDRDKPLGQRRGDGYHFGIPTHSLPWTAMRRVSVGVSDELKRDACGWLDRAGQPHGRHLDKMARKINAKTLTIVGGRRGPYDGMMLPAKFPFSNKRK